eukprot:Seg4057.1 transcript_id=Seg4057.1/GoldUCD/mRNA.D3Y31 product="Regulator of microtubule dynamics protein 1" protein_id=Seg4057.1/GoldUCD/D3Y31
MDSSDWKRHLGFSIGLGVGIVIGLFAHKLYKKKRKKHHDEFAKAVENLTSEVSQLKEMLSCISKASSKITSENIDIKRTGKMPVNYDDDDDDDDVDDDNDVYFDFVPNVEEIQINQELEDVRDVFNDDVGSHLKQSENLRLGTDEERKESHKLLLKLLKQNQETCEILWRLSRAQYDMGMLAGKNGNQNEKEQFLKEAMESGKKAIELDDGNASAHKWYGIAIGSYCEFVGSQEKIKLGYQYKEHIEKAIKLNPHDPSAYSLLGRWCYEVSMLPWYLRKAAAAIFGEPPSSSIDEALSYAMKAEELKANFWIENSLLIAKCYYQKSDYINARSWLNKAKEFPITSEDDSIAQKEIEQLLSKV